MCNQNDIQIQDFLGQLEKLGHKPSSKEFDPRKKEYPPQSRTDSAAFKFEQFTRR